MLVNTFIITPKPEYTDALIITSHLQKITMASLIPEKYRTLFKSIVKDSVNNIMDNRDHQRAYSIMAEAMITGYGALWYPDTGADSLQQIIRRTFYNTLLIIKNDYNPYKYDYFIIVLSQEVISEHAFESCRYPKHNGYKKRNNGQILVCDFSRPA